MRALLQQPGLFSKVQEVCSEVWNNPHALNGLWWCLSKRIIKLKIEELEYGVRQRVDDGHPGIALPTLEAYVRELLSPHAAIPGAELISGDPTPTHPPTSEKPLPPTPIDRPEDANLLYHEVPLFQHARSYLQPNGQQMLAGSSVYAAVPEKSPIDSNPTAAHPTVFGKRSPPSSIRQSDTAQMPYHDESLSQHNCGYVEPSRHGNDSDPSLYSTIVEGWTAQQSYNESSIPGASSESFQGWQDFQRSQLAENIEIDPMASDNCDYFSHF